MTYRHSFVSTCLTAAIASAALIATDAEACGGLFCNAAQPVNQAAERIIFAKNDDGTVTAAIEIMYEGESDEFAWVLPVPPGETTVGVSSINAFDALDQRTNPLYQLNTSFEDGCDAVQRGGAVGAPSPGIAVSDSEGDNGPTIQVVAEGNAGPYDWVQIEVPDELDDPADAAVMWLEEQGFDVTDIGPDLLRDYLEDGLNLIAFKLSKGKDAGSIRPILLTYESERPFIPIRPTAVAANEDMGIKVWVLGDSRAIPNNYFHLELNEAMINWFNPTPTYNDVIIAAANEADKGQGFVTELSGPAGMYAEDIYPQFQQDWWEQLRTGRFDSLPEFFSTAQNYFAGFDGFNDVMLDPEVLPLREGATHEQFASCVQCYFETDVAVRNEAYPETPYLGDEDPINGPDVVSNFLNALERLVITPLEETRAMFEDNAQVTRFYTTLSPDEMDVDPDFEFNSDLPDVDNVHVAERIMQCDSDGWTIVLPQGMRIHGTGQDWPVDLDSSFPVNLRIVQLSPDGEGKVVTDNAEKISLMLTDLDIGEALPELMDPDSNSSDGDDPDDASDGEPAASDSGGCGCRVGHRDEPTSPAWLLLLGLPLLRRGRRRA